LNNFARKISGFLPGLAHERAAFILPLVFLLSNFPNYPGRAIMVNHR
jgi:hypothetical protein